MSSDIDDTYIYMRINPGEEVGIDMGYFVLCSSLRRKGHFSSLVNKFKLIKHVGYITVSSVLTDEMRMAAIDNGFEAHEEINGYKIKIT